jgi:hypothetical protein
MGLSIRRAFFVLSLGQEAHGSRLVFEPPYEGNRPVVLRDLLRVWLLRFIANRLVTPFTPYVLSDAFSELNFQIPSSEECAASRPCGVSNLFNLAGLTWGVKLAWLLNGSGLLCWTNASASPEARPIGYPTSGSEGVDRHHGLANGANCRIPLERGSTRG